MATEKTLKTRVVLKHDTEANWNKATTFIPKKGEVIIYDPDNTHTYSRQKIGDGEKTVVSLPFSEFVYILTFYYPMLLLHIFLHILHLKAYLLGSSYVLRHQDSTYHRLFFQI